MHVQMMNPQTELQAELTQALGDLTEKQRRFALALPTSKTLIEAMTFAGYGGEHPNSRSSYAYRLSRNPKIRKVVDLSIQVDMLKNGIGTAWKRKELVELFLDARKDGQYSAANSIMRTLAQIDGDLAPESAVNVNINSLPEIRDISPEDLETVSKVYREVRGLSAPVEVIDEQ